MDGEVGAHALLFVGETQTHDGAQYAVNNGTGDHGVDNADNRADELAHEPACACISDGGAALDGLPRLHHADGDGEAFEVLGEAAAGRAPQEPGPQFLGIRRGELDALRVGEFDDGLGAEAPVEMVVEEHLGEALDDVEGHFCHAPD